MKMTWSALLRGVSGGGRFLAVMVLAEIVLFLWDRTLFFGGLGMLYGLLSDMLPVLLVVLFSMTAINYLVTPTVVMRYMGGSGSWKWPIAVIGGILSVGPVYFWYPILADLKKKGLSDGLVACFLYNRAIKVPLFPLAAYYFGWQYVVILTMTMVLASFVQARVLTSLINAKRS